MKPLVSIIVPIYNAESFLDDCLESILKQTYENIEVLLIDDGSTDNSFSICEKYKNNDNRIKLIKQENSGVSITRNNGIKNANGEYIIFVDSDDVCDLKMVEILLQKSINKEVDYVLGNIKIVDTELHDIGYCDLPNGVYSKEQYLKKILLVKDINYVCGAPYSKLFKTSIIKNNNILFDVDLSYAEDFVFNLDYVKYAHKISTTSNVLYKYRFGNAQSLTYKNILKTNPDDFFEARLKIYRKWKDTIKMAEGVSDLQIEKLLSSFLIDSCTCCCIKLPKRDAKEKMKSFISTVEKESNDWNAFKRIKQDNRNNEIKFFLLKKNMLSIYYLLIALNKKRKKL